LTERGQRVTRRRTPVAAAGGPVMAVGSATTGHHPAAAQPATRTKGPRVWLDLDQAELDAAYDQSAWAPNREQLLRRHAAQSAAVRTRLGAPLRYAYGPTPVEGLDVYITPSVGAPINVLIHGGAWRAGLARNYAYVAELFVRAGAHLVVPDFAPVQDVGGSLMRMAEQVRRAVAWVYRNARRFGGDPARLYVSGHSSGAHLAGVILTTDWPRELDLPADVVKGGLCSSGMYDLKPVRLSARSSYVKFTDETEEALSPQRHLDRLNAPLVVSHGTLDSPEFQRQARDFAAAVRAAGKPVELLVGDDYNHFEIFETLGTPYGLLGRAVLAQMKLSQGATS
jgi:arylformamidase